MAEKKIEREAGRQFTLEGKTVKQGEKVQLTPKMEKYLDGLADNPLVPKTTAKKAS
jgi:hypothetical protein